MPLDSRCCVYQKKIDKNKRIDFEPQWLSCKQALSSISQTRVDVMKFCELVLFIERILYFKRKITGIQSKRLSLDLLTYLNWTQWILWNSQRKVFSLQTINDNATVLKLVLCFLFTVEEKVVRMQYDESMSGKLNICIHIFSSESQRIL